MTGQSASRFVRRDRMRVETAKAISDPVPRLKTFERVSSSHPDRAHEKPLWQAMAWFIVPQTANAALQLVSGTITAIYLGQLLGHWALAVASVFFPIFSLLASFLIGLITGGIVLVARAHGAGDVQQIKSVTGTTLSVCTLLSIAIAAIGYRWSAELLGIMGTPPEILVPAVAYARVTFISLPVVTLLFASTYLLRGMGDAYMPLLVTASCIGICALLTPALIGGWWGLPKLGVTSAPWANLAACAITLPALAVYLRSRRHPMAFDRDLLRRLWIDPQIARSFFAIGIPGGVQMAVTSVSEVAVVCLVNPFGSSATAAYGAVNQVVGYLLAPMQAVGLAATVFAAQAVGARQIGRLGAVTRIAITLNILIGASAVGILCLFSQSVLSWFVVDPVTLSIARRALMLTLWSYVFVGIGSVLAGVMRSTGAVLWPAAFAIAAIWLVQLPTAYLLSRSVGVEGVWMGYPAGFIAALMAQVLYYALVWRPRPGLAFEPAASDTAAKIVDPVPR
jgi:putative MATE family efflux protein